MVKPIKSAMTTAVLAHLLLAHNVLAGPDVDFGKVEYESSCASCHGLSGKGDGPLARALVSQPSDLTTLAKRNGGVFPAQRVHKIIDGREDVEAHGTREMPVWGREYQSAVLPRGESGAFDFGPSIANARIASVVDYLYRIQEP
jgi:mono/diheme cytochrome c family protein